MGRHKKAHNVVKIDLREDVLGKARALPLLIQQSSKDGRRLEQSVHKILAPQIYQPPPTFDPFPTFATAEGCTFPESYDTAAEPSGAERMRVCFLT